MTEGEATEGEATEGEVTEGRAEREDGEPRLRNEYRGGSRPVISSLAFPIFRSLPGMMRSLKLVTFFASFCIFPFDPLEPVAFDPSARRAFSDPSAGQTLDPSAAG